MHMKFKVLLTSLIALPYKTMLKLANASALYTQCNTG